MAGTLLVRLAYFAGHLDICLQTLGWEKSGKLLEQK
jgi:hypothetical protein